MNVYLVNSRNLTKVVAVYSNLDAAMRRCMDDIESEEENGEYTAIGIEREAELRVYKYPLLEKY